MKKIVVLIALNPNSKLKIRPRQRSNLEFCELLIFKWSLSRKYFMIEHFFIRKYRNS